MKGKEITLWLRLAICVMVVGSFCATAVFARAEVTGKGNLRVAVSGKLAPVALPRSGTAPVAVSLGGKVTTTDGSEPPPLKQLVIEINRHGQLDPTGLATCEFATIHTASNGRALGACRSSLVGEGRFEGTLTLPDAAPYPIDGKLLVFNGIEHGRHVLYGHIFSSHPFATSSVITFQIKHGGKGNYGTVLTANLKKAFGSQKNLTGIEMTLDRRYVYLGTHRSYVTAGCPAPSGVNVVAFPLARTTFSFAGDGAVTAVLNRSCKVRG